MITNSMLFLRRFWLSLFLAFLFMRPVVSTYWDELNRFFFHWHGADAFAVLIAIAVPGVLFFGAYLLARRVGGWVQRIFEFVFVGFTLFYLKVAVGEMLSLAPWLSRLLKYSVIALCFSFFVWRRRLVRLVESISLMLSPVLILFIINLVGAQTFVSERVIRAPPNADSPAAGQPQQIFVFLFDQWSYQLTAGADARYEEFPNISRAAAISVNFDQAYSPAPLTASSLPSLLCGTVGHAAFSNGVHYLLADQGAKPTRDQYNIFDAMKARGYQTALYANYYPWPELITHGLDTCQSKDLYKYFCDVFLGSSGQMMLDVAELRLGWLSPALRRYRRLKASSAFVEITTWTHSKALAAIGAKQPSFIFVHYPVPHQPYIFTSTGPKADLSAPWHSSREEYLDNMRYTDRLIGELLDAIKRRADYQQCMFVLLSDHTFHHDVDLAGASVDDFCHVPLLIHLPGQTNRMNVAKTFSTSNLLPLLLELQSSSATTEDAIGVCDKYLGRPVSFAYTQKELENFWEMIRLIPIAR